MPVSRMRMRPWLEQMINSRRFSGLQWVDQEKTIFTIPWRHAARHGWEIGIDASLFKEWAIHTGKYVEGQECDPKTWKANFRCALNSLPDIEEVKNKSVHRGHGAMRVFRIIPVPPRPKGWKSRAKQRRQAKVKYESDTSDSDSVPSPPQALTPTLRDSPDSTMDSTVKSELPDHSYINSDDVPIWSRPGFEFPRKFEVSPAHSTADNADDEIIKLCEEWERERQGTMGNNGFLYNVALWRPGSPYSSGSSAADELEEVRYTNLASSFSTTTSNDMNMNNLASSFSNTTSEDLNLNSLASSFSTTEDMSTVYSFTDSLSLK